MSASRPEMKFTKVERGWYATEDGKWAVIVDGYAPSNHAGKDSNWKPGAAGNLYEGFVGGEWSLTYFRNGDGRTAHNSGENLDWYPTKKAAIADAPSFARRLELWGRL